MLSSSLLLYVLFWAKPTRSSSSADFSSYPATTRTCLSKAFDQSDCAGDTVTETNSCLCSNDDNFVTNTAICIGDQGNDVVVQVYDIMQDSCSDTKTPLSISEAEFLTAANSTISFIAITSTVTTTSAGMATTFTTTTTSTSTAIAATPTSSSSSSSDDDDDDDDEDDDDGQITVSAKVGAISASVAGVLMVACVTCLVILLKKRKKDKALLQQVRDEARGHRSGGSHSSGGGDKPLLDPGAMTPGLPGTPTTGGRGDGCTIVFGASVTPPTPTYPGPTSPQVWRSNSQNSQHQNNLGRGPTSSPSELPNEQWTYELYDSRSAQQSPYQINRQGHGQVPSPVSQGFGTMGSWCPSPASATASSTAVGPYGTGTGTGTYRSEAGNGTMGSSIYSVAGTAGIGTLGAISTLSQPLSRQITGATMSRSSWAHNRPVQDEPYELPGTEVRSINPLPVEADSTPVMRVPPERLSMSISQAPPEYTPGGWIDPNTDKPPIGMI